jgi:hypothetical protein
MSRIEVRNLDAWVLRFLRSKRYEQSIVYGRQNEAATCWHLALAVKDASLGLDDGADDNARYKSLSHGPTPLMESCPSREALVARVNQKLTSSAKA